MVLPQYRMKDDGRYQRCARFSEPICLVGVRPREYGATRRLNQDVALPRATTLVPPCANRAMHVIDMSRSHGKRTKVTDSLPVAQNVLSKHAGDIQKNPGTSCEILAFAVPLVGVQSRAAGKVGCGAFSQECGLYRQYAVRRCVVMAGFWVGAGRARASCQSIFGPRCHGYTTFLSGGIAGTVAHPLGISMQPHMLGQHAVGWVKDRWSGYNGRADASRDATSS